ncbi:MAG: glutathione synthase [Candidatus Dasytiphilus stammeri]
MIKLGIIMDPISNINLNKDSSFAILLEAQRRKYEIHYMELKDLFLQKGRACARTRILNVKNNQYKWYSFSNEYVIGLHELNVIFMRKDPPLDQEFIYATYMLEHAENQGTIIINKPQSLRDCNEKIFTTWFPDLIPDTLVTRNQSQILNFWRKHSDIILKPLDGMGGSSVFRIKPDDVNVSVIIENLTAHGKCYCMAQEFIAEIIKGDKRVFIVDGEPIPYCLARKAQCGETRSNLAVGGIGEVQSLSVIDMQIVRRITPILQQKGLLFVGLDIIGDKLTEINVTSPTCIREIEAASSYSITSKLMNMIEKRL